MTKAFGLVDCNNFYASAEKVFNPKLHKKPVVVLSNNDGCIISRSDEARQIGVKMGAPLFRTQNLPDKFRRRLAGKVRVSKQSIHDQIRRDFNGYLTTPRFEVSINSTSKSTSLQSVISSLIFSRA
ncbi:MAG: hypothetical protein WA584_05325 [Pyrinomonadaceae bacterium]